MASLAAGNGALSDVDALRGDDAQRELLGLREAPSSRRLGEFPARLTKRDVESLDGVLRHLSASLAPAVVAHEVSERGYVPVFVDGTGIEVDGRLFEHAARLYTGERGYWLHGVFVGGLWVSGRLRPGGDVACGWKGQMKRDLAPLLPPRPPIPAAAARRLTMSRRLRAPSRPSPTAPDLWTRRNSGPSSMPEAFSHRRSRAAAGLLEECERKPRMCCETRVRDRTGVDLANAPGNGTIPD